MRKQKETGGLRRWYCHEIVHQDVAILHGEWGVTVYHCKRILKYEPQRICFLLQKRKISVCGNHLICTAFSAGAARIEGEISGIFYCNDAKRCQHCEVGELEGTE